MSEPLRCPGCGQAMQAYRQVLDRCPGCGGIWLDAGELEGQRARLPEDLVAVSGGRELPCPRCEEPLSTFRGQLLEVDLCERCGGTYLDRGELELLVRERRLTAQSSEGGQASFACDRCQRRVPLAEQVVGEQETVCALCAERHGIGQAARRRRAAARASQAGRPHFTCSRCQRSLPEPQRVSRLSEAVCALCAERHGLGTAADRRDAALAARGVVPEEQAAPGSSGVDAALDVAGGVLGAAEVVGGVLEVLGAIADLF